MGIGTTEHPTRTAGWNGRNVLISFEKWLSEQIIPSPPPPKSMGVTKQSRQLAPPPPPPRRKTIGTPTPTLKPRQRFVVARGASLDSPSSGFRRLYRGESKSVGGKHATYASGRWWTNNVEIALWYIKDKSFDKNNNLDPNMAQLVYTDVTEDVYQKYNVANILANPALEKELFQGRVASKDPKGEWFLPPEVIENATKKLIPTEIVPE